MSRSGWLVGPLVGVVSLLAPAAVADDPQIRLQVDEPFRLGGHSFDAGVIALRGISSFTPTLSILELWVGGECRGMVTARRSVSEAAQQQTEALVRRDDAGRLEIVGFTVTGNPTVTTYRFP